MSTDIRGHQATQPTYQQQQQCARSSETANSRKVLVSKTVVAVTIGGLCRRAVKPIWAAAGMAVSPRRWLQATYWFSGQGSPRYGTPFVSKLVSRLVS